MEDISQVVVMEKKDSIIFHLIHFQILKALTLHSATLMPRILILLLNGCEQPEFLKCLFNHSYFSQLEKIIANIYERVNIYN